MGWIALWCTRRWLSIWSVDFLFPCFVLGGEKPKIQSPPDVWRAKSRLCFWQVGCCAALTGRWCLQISAHCWNHCWAGGDVQKEGGHQRAEEDSGEIVSVARRPGRFMPKMSEQQQAEFFMSLEGPTWWPVTAGRTHHMLCMSVVPWGLQPC